MEVTLPEVPERVWEIMVDIPRIASCIPGCEDVKEEVRLSQYSAVLKQKIGPFKLEVPAEVVVDEYDQPRFMKAHATGMDKLTRTRLSVTFDISLAPVESGSTLFTVAAELQVAGRLATLGYPLIKKKAEENFAEFEKRIRAQLEVI